MTHTAFVAGATGYTGQEVVRVLLERGARTVAHIRPGSSKRERLSAHFADLGAEVDVTAWEEEAMAATLEALAPTLVFALLGTTRSRAREAAREGREVSYETVDYGLTATLIRAAVASGHRPRFVYLSSLGAEEGTSNAYLKARVKAERDLRESGLPYTIARPSFISGPDRQETRVGERVAATVADVGLGLLGALGARKLRDRYRSTDAASLARALVHYGMSDEGEDEVISSEALHLDEG